MTVEVKSPSEREDWRINPEMFADGPDTWSASESQGWRLYLVETLPYRGIYALTKYSWKNSREDELVDIGEVSVSGNISEERVNEVLEDNDVDKLSDGQFELLKSEYDKYLLTILRNSTLEKNFEIFDHTIYFEAEGWDEYLQDQIKDTTESIENLLEDVEVGKTHTYPKYVSEEKIERMATYEPLSNEQLENISLIEEAVEKPHGDSVKYAKFCQIVGDIEFETLDPYMLRAIELVQNGVFHNNVAVAVVQALLEEGLSQREVAEKLDKDESTISKQASVAQSLTQRARWQAANVTTDNRQ
jgi:predicted transcriptional regulator